MLVRHGIGDSCCDNQRWIDTAIINQPSPVKLDFPTLTKPFYMFFSQVPPNQLFACLLRLTTHSEELNQTASGEQNERPQPLPSGLNILHKLIAPRNKLKHILSILSIYNILEACNPHVNGIVHVICALALYWAWNWPSQLDWWLTRLLRLAHQRLQLNRFAD